MSSTYIAFGPEVSVAAYRDALDAALRQAGDMTPVLAKPPKPKPKTKKIDPRKPPKPENPKPDGGKPK